MKKENKIKDKIVRVYMDKKDGILKAEYIKGGK